MARVTVEHVALWAEGLERTRVFWKRLFGATSNDEHANAAGFHSHFMTLEGGARVELMHRYAEDLAIGQIARAGGVSQREAQREFQEVLGRQEPRHASSRMPPRKSSQARERGA